MARGWALADALMWSDHAWPGVQQRADPEPQGPGPAACRSIGSLLMGLLDRLRGRTREQGPVAVPMPSRAPVSSMAATPSPAVPPASRPPVTRPASRSFSASDPDDESNQRWYVPPDGNTERFIGADGLPGVHLIQYPTGEGVVLRFCEDSTGLLVGPTDRRLLPAGLLVSNLRGGRYYEHDCRAGDFRPGTEMRLVPEPDNPHDDRAVAAFDQIGRYRAGYLNKQKARAYLKRITAGEVLAAISLRGSGPGIDTGVVSILVATPAMLAHVRAPRPPGSPPPVYTMPAT